MNTQKMITGKNAFRARACPRKVFMASVNGLSREQKKAMWQERQAVFKERQAEVHSKKEEIMKDISEFQSSLDGLSTDEKREKWHLRLEGAQAHFVEATHDHDHMAMHLARLELNKNRFAAKQAGMLKNARRAKEDAKKDMDGKEPSDEFKDGPEDKKDDADVNMDGKAKFEPTDEFKKDLEDFAASMKSLSNQEQKVQWKKRIQELQGEVRKARMMVDMTRRARREVAKAKKSGVTAAADFEMVEAKKEETDETTNQDDEMNQDGGKSDGIAEADFEMLEAEKDTEPISNQEDNEMNLADEAFEEVRVEEEPTKPADNEDSGDDFVVCA